MRSRLKAANTIILSFVLLIIIGAVLLSLPIANQNGRFLPPIDALFTATSAVCVTGLVTIVPATQLTLFGQIVLLFLIQIGGLGLMVLVASFVLLVRQRFTLKERLVLRQVVNHEQSFHVIPVLKAVVLFTFILEGLGALFLSFRLVPIYGLFKGLYTSIWHAISAFCNAGFDVFGTQSIIGFGKDAYMLIIFSCLIISAGIGFPVWQDLTKKTQMLYRRKLGPKRFFDHLEVHTKIVLIMTFFLLIGGMIAFFIFEHDNPQTFGSWTFTQQVMGSFFQSTTTRTAGFSGVAQSNLTDASSFITTVLMFIGGSPAGTAGGVKTITIAILILSIFQTIKGREKVVVYKRRIDKDLILKALTIVMLALLIAISAIVLLSVIEKNNPNASFKAIFFEVFSALGTVGLTLDLTPYLSWIGKIVIMILMLLGRVGPLTLFVSIAANSGAQKKDKIDYLKAKIIVG